MSKIKAVIFDWAGTTVDYGCFAPVNAFFEAFKKFGIEPTIDEVREPMGMLKIDHIRTMMNMNRINTIWNEKYGRNYSEEDILKIHDEFEESLLSSLDRFAEPKNGVIETVNRLKQDGIKVGSTTGYTDKMMDIVKPSAKKYGYEPEVCITPDMTCKKGRPYPYMIFENMKQLGIMSVREVLKIGDTVSDIKEGVNAGVWTAGVIEGSSELGLTEAEFNALSPDECSKKSELVCKKFLEAGADFVIANIAELYDILSKIK